MQVLTVGGAGPLTGLLAAQLAEAHSVRLLALPGQGGGALDAVPEKLQRRVECVEGDLLDPECAWRAVRGVDAVVHTGELPAWVSEPGGDATDQSPEPLLDWFTRGTHVLFKAAVEAGVRRAVLGSTLDLFQTYPLDVYITEHWQPRPEPRPEPMARYLAELVLREFVRDFRLSGTVLRLGHLAGQGCSPVPADDLTWLDVRDAVAAFALALEIDRSDQVRWNSRWLVYHVCGDRPNARFLIDAARRAGWCPRHAPPGAAGPVEEAAG